MKLITRDTDYALRAISFIAQQKAGVVPVTHLVERLKIPRPFLRKILQILSRKGILKSSKGKGGGFSLLLPPDKIFVVDLIDIFQQPIQSYNCFIGKNMCPDVRTCILKRKLGEIEKQVATQLKAIHVASLMNGWCEHE